VIAAYSVDTAAIRHLSRSRIFVDEESAEYERSLEETGRRRLAFAEELAKAKGMTVATRLLKGSIAGEVVRLAEEAQADCILLGGWEHNGIFRYTHRSESRNRESRSCSRPHRQKRGRRAGI